MYRPKDTQERIVHRLKISMGHLKKVVQMVQEDKYCVDIIHQSQAIQKALKEVDNLLLENHLKSCTVDNIKSGEDKKAIEEIVNIFKLSR